MVNNISTNNIKSTLHSDEKSNRKYNIKTRQVLYTIV